MEKGKSRRTFMMKLIAGTSALAAGKVAFSQTQAPVKISESDPQAVAVGYKDDATKVDKAKFPKYAPGQVCLNCQLYLGSQPPTAPCAIFGNKHVAAAGWCSAWVKKAG